MTPEDPRHGSTAGYRAGCHETCCRDAINSHNQRLILLRLQGAPPRMVPITGTRRRLEALAAIGWSHAAISARLGWHSTRLAATIRIHQYIHETTARKVAEMYAQLSMTIPHPQTPGEVMSVNRTIALARRRGYAPPLAWTNIDDPNEVPAGVRGDELTRLRVTRPDLDQRPCGRCGVVRQARKRSDLCSDCQSLAKEAS